MATYALVLIVGGNESTPRQLAISAAPISIFAIPSSQGLPSWFTDLHDCLYPEDCAWLPNPDGFSDFYFDTYHMDSVGLQCNHLLHLGCLLDHPALLENREPGLVVYLPLWLFLTLQYIEVFHFNSQGSYNLPVSKQKMLYQQTLP